MVDRAVGFETVGRQSDFSGGDGMNPYRIYRDEWEDALAHQATAKEYTTFVAMPLRDHFSYRSKSVLSDVIVAAATEANRRGEAKRKFAEPKTIDGPMGAIAITEEIVLGILGSHFFIGDLTFQNAGVIFETGIALAMKPNRQVIAILQGEFEELHFDLKINKAIRYGQSDSVGEIASALINSARHFEDQVQYHIVSVRQRIGPDSMGLLNWYGQCQRANEYVSLHQLNRGPNFSGADGPWRFEAAASELRKNRLLWTDYRPFPAEGVDKFGMHATEFGWAVIESTWPELHRSEASLRAARERSEPPPRMSEESSRE
jgi:hypothetical protein